jgi:hypothetical protein
VEHNLNVKRKGFTSIAPMVYMTNASQEAASGKMDNQYKKV